MLTSTTPLQIDDVTLHPWADPPKSVGALAAMQICIFASDNDIAKNL